MKLFSHWRIALFVSIVAIGGFVLFQYSWLDRVSAYYPSYASAERNGAISRGWIPEFIPPSATEIHEEHDLDTNQVWIRFRVPGTDVHRMVQAMRRLPDDEVLSLKYISPQEGWWFEALVQQTPANDNALNAEIYTSNCLDDKGRAFIAVDRVQPLVFYWCQL